MKIDIGCGPNKREGFQGMDQYDLPGVDFVHDVRVTPWPFEDGEITEAHCSHFLEHLTGQERVQFFNELYRVMAPGAQISIITPHWASNRAYGDFTHQWPPVAEFTYMYVSKAWRTEQAIHTDISVNSAGYSCDFEGTWGYTLHQNLHSRNEEFRQFAVANYKEAAQDLCATLTRK
jgi:hypothetical protein